MDSTLEKVSGESREISGSVSTAVSIRKSRMRGGVDPIKVKSRERAKMSLRRNCTDCGAEKKLAEVVANSAHRKIIPQQTPMCQGMPWCLHGTRERHFRELNRYRQRGRCERLLASKTAICEALVSVLCQMSASI